MVGDNVPEAQVLPIREALRLADEMELDLIEISPKADPPVCRIADYQKFLYQLKRKAKEIKANQTKVVIKEIRFGPQTDDHDYNFKLKHAQNFLKEGAKVKAYVFFRGRSIVFKEQGEILLLRFATDLEEVAKVEMMPKLDGLSVLKTIRDEGNCIPVLILTAKSEIDDRVAGLDAGADDYLTKPFSMGELLARIRAITRRKSEFSPNLLSSGNLSLNRETFELSVDGNSIRLGNKEFQMIEMLMVNPGRLISTEQFMERIWGYETEAEINVWYFSINKL